MKDTTCYQSKTLSGFVISLTCSGFGCPCCLRLSESRLDVVDGAFLRVLFDEVIFNGKYKEYTTLSYIPPSKEMDHQ